MGRKVIQNCPDSRPGFLFTFGLGCVVHPLIQQSKSPVAGATFAADAVNRHPFTIQSFDDQSVTDWKFVV